MTHRTMSSTTKGEIGERGLTERRKKRKKGDIEIEGGGGGIPKKH